MYSNHYWDNNIWGTEYPPVNADEIISAANDLIDAYIAENGDDEACEYSDQLWTIFCCTGAIGDVIAVYDQE